MTDARIDADAFNAFEARGWESKAGGYDDLFRHITPRLVEPLLDAAGVGAGDRVLDVASGPGYVAAAAAERGAVVTGLDIAEAMVSLARGRHPQIEFRQGDAEALPFADGSFDVVAGNFVLLHLGRPERAAAEFARVLRPGGRLALTVWDVPERSRFIGVLLDAVAEGNADPAAGIPPGPPFFRFSDEQELAGLLRDQGLEGIEVQTIAFEHGVPSPAAYWDGLLGGTVRLSELVSRQPDGVQHAIRAAFDRILEQYRVGGQIELPVSVKLASGRKAADPGTGDRG